MNQFCMSKIGIKCNILVISFSLLVLIFLCLWGETALDVWNINLKFISQRSI